MEAQGRADEHGSSGEVSDYYRLLQVDPDAPQELVAEAYWYLASRLRAELAVRRSAERELAALNAAYQVLAVAEQRRVFDATVPRVQELRRERAEKAQLQEKASFPFSLFKKRQGLPVDYYELLRVDPAAGAPLIARAYSILRTLHSKEATGQPQGNYLEELAQARSVLLDRSRRAAYDESRIRASLALEALPAPEAKPDQQTTEVHLESPAGEPQVRQPREQTAEPRWQVRAASPAFKAIVAVAEGGTRIAVVAARLGYRGLLWPAKTGGKGLALAIRAAWRGGGRLRRNRPLKQPPGPPADDRLLRATAPSSPKANGTERDRPCLGRLVVRGPGGDQDAFALGKEPVTLGMDRECDISLKTEAHDVAPAHAQIWFTGERFIIRSLDPMHPTVLCGQRVTWAGLDDGDEIEIGPYRLTFEAVAARDTPPDFLTTEQGAVANAEEIPERHE